MPTDVTRQNDAAKLLEVSRQYINKLVKDGKIKSYTSAKLVSLKEVKEFMKGSQVPSWQSKPNMIYYVQG